MLESLPVGRLRRALHGDFVRDGAIIFGSTMLANVLSYAIHFILSRKIGVTEYGAFASLVNAVAIFGIPAAIVTMVVVKFVAEFHALDERGKIRVLSQRILMGCGGLAAILVILAVALRVQIAAYLHLADAAGVVAAAFALGCALLLPAIRGVLQGAQDFAAFAISTSIEAICRVGLAVIFVYAGYGVAGAFAGYSLASLLSLAYTLSAVRKHWSDIPTPLAIDTRRLLVTMGGVIVGTAAITVMSSIDIPLVKHFFSARDAGIYSAAAICGKMLFFVVGFVPALVLPKAAQRAAAGEPARAVLFQGLALTVALAASGLAVFLAAPQFVVRVTYGAAFVGAASYLFKYGLAMSLLGITNVVVTYKIGLHRYNFVWPLVCTAVSEPIAIQYFHTSLWSVINVLLAVNAVALTLCFLGEKSGIAVSLRHAFESRMKRTDGVA